MVDFILLFILRAEYMLMQIDRGGQIVIDSLLSVDGFLSLINSRKNNEFHVGEVGVAALPVH